MVTKLSWRRIRYLRVKEEMWQRWWWCGGTREKDREEKDSSPLSLSMPHQWEVRGGGGGGKDERFFISFFFCHILYICECSFLVSFSISSFLTQRIVQAASSLFISLRSFVNSIFTSILTPKDNQWRMKHTAAFIYFQNHGVDISWTEDINSGGQEVMHTFTEPEGYCFTKWPSETIPRQPNPYHTFKQHLRHKAQDIRLCKLQATYFVDFKV